MIRGKTLQLRLGENINVPKISGSPIRNTDCIAYSKIFLLIFIIQVHINTVKWLLTSPYKIDKIFCKNSCDTFMIQNSVNF